jgi:hypothetical protein
MALWADCRILTASDLLQYDGQLSSVVSSEGIDVDSKSQVAHEQITGILATRFPHQNGLRTEEVAERIVVTAPLRRWHAIATLEAVYREAYFRHLSERYKGRADYLMAKASDAMAMVMESGLGVCDFPVRRAAQPELVSASGSIGSGVWHVAVTWVESGVEGEGSEIVSIILTEPGGITVRPGVIGSGQLMFVYAGASPDRLCRQMAVPVPASVPFVLSGIGQEGQLIGWGQQPDRFLRPDRRILRG